MEFTNTFNLQRIDTNYIQTFNRQMEEYIHKQNEEVANAVKAFHDFCNAMEKLDPPHQNYVRDVCLTELISEMLSQSPNFR